MAVCVCSSEGVGITRKEANALQLTFALRIPVTHFWLSMRCAFTVLFLNIYTALCIPQFILNV